MENNDLKIFRQENLFGLKRADGSMVLSPCYDHIDSLDNELLRVRIGNKWGLITRDGSVILKPTYQSMYGVFEGRVGVKLNNKWGFVDLQGEVVIPLEYDEIGNFLGAKEGFDRPMAYAKKNGTCGVIGLNGEVILPFEYEEICEECEGHYVISEDGDMGLIDQKGNVVIPCEYEDMEYLFKMGLLKVAKEGKYGIVDMHGQEVVKLIYGEIDYFSGDFCPVKRNEKWNLIDRKGNLVLEKWHDEVKLLDGPTLLFRDGNSFTYGTTPNGPTQECQIYKKGIYSKDGRTLLAIYDFDVLKEFSVLLEDVCVKEGCECLAYEPKYPDEPEGTRRFQLTDYTRRITFEKGVTTIGEGWDGNKEYWGKDVDIYLPSTLRKVHHDAFRNLEFRIGHIYVPTGARKMLDTVLPRHLSPYVKEISPIGRWWRQLIYNLKR